MPGKKRKTSDQSSSAGDRFDNICNVFASRQKECMENWLIHLGIPKSLQPHSRGQVNQEDCCSFAEDFQKLLQGHLHNTLIRTVNDTVPTMKLDQAEKKSVFESIEEGPEHYILIPPSNSEGRRESFEKYHNRSKFEQNNAELSRAIGLGGIISAEESAKALMGHIKALRRASIVQRATNIALADGMTSVKERHIRAAFASEGIIIG